MLYGSGRQWLAGVTVLIGLTGHVCAQATGSQSGAEGPQSDANSVSSSGRDVRHTSSIAWYQSRGYYREPTATRVRYLPFSHEVVRDGWRFKATLPWLEVEGPGNILINLGNVGGMDYSDGVTAVSGAGDVLLSATYELPMWSETAPFIDIGVEIKLPTADERKGLGTGKMDVGVQVDLYQMLGSATTFVTLGYRYRQPSPYFGQLLDSWALSLGVSHPLGETLQAGVIADYRQQVTRFTDHTRELLPYISWSLDPRWSLMLYYSRGFSEDGPDHAFGTQLSLRW